jgi:hypothetical protein
MNYVVPLGITLANVGLAWSSDQEGLASRTVPLLFGITMASLFETCRRRNLIAPAAVVLLTDMAYIFNAGHALTFGAIAARDIYSPPEAVASALLNVAIFLTEIVIGAAIIERLTPIKLRSGTTPEAPRQRRLHFIALLLLVAATFVAAFLAGTWSAYGVQFENDAQEASEAADFRWQMLYEPSLMAGIAVALDDLVRAVEAGKSLRTKKAVLAALGALSLLLFVKQVRRFMALSLVLSLLQATASPYVRAKVLSRPRQLITGAMFLILLPVVLNFGSLAWRRSARVFHTTNIAERLTDTASRLNEVDQEELSNTTHRFTYLSVDAAAVQYGAYISNALEINELFVRSLVFAVPKILFRGKSRFMPATCETAFQQLHPTAVDMACSTTSEGYIAAGVGGVLVVGLPFAFLTAIASFLFRRRTVFSIVWGVQILSAMATIEGGAFGPMVYAMRGSALVLGAMVVIVGVLRGLLGWGFGGGLRRMPRRTSLAPRHA